MPLSHVPHFSLAARHPGRLDFVAAASNATHVAHVFVLEDDLIRVMLLPGGELRFPKTWAIAPGQDDVACAGRDRLDTSGFSLPAYAVDETADALVITTANIRLRIDRAGFRCTWELRDSDGRGWRQVASDRPTQSYNFGWWDEKVYHYLKREPDEMYFGLGERAGEADRMGQSYRLCNVDPMGYSARTTDPLYKHIPFYLTWKKDSRRAFGLFYDTLSDCTFNMGRELDNYHGHYRYFVADHGDLDYYFIADSVDDGLASVTRRFTWLTGRPAFTPRWGLGYSGSTMTYTDAPDAQQRMGEFVAGCRAHDILCDSFHLSSGYTSIGGKRYVFNWNRDKFPDPAGFVRSYLDDGVRLCANIKPCLLRDHPRFAEAQAAGLFISNPDGSPALVQFWDEAGAYLDFTNPATVDWWKARVRDALLDYGIASTWNDNNEFEVWSGVPLANGFGAPRPACQAKPLHTLLMIRASREAQVEHAPGKRPFLISRSGAAGMQRYVQTWSGDNMTAWETLRYNLRMGLGLAMSGISNSGHDIGGFSGPAPDPELFVRWVQQGIFLPRFSIHSWNDDGSVNEPWMYPEVTPYVRDLIKLRYRLIPYLYDLLWRYHTRYEPMTRPTLHDFPDDARCFEANDEMLLGAQLLVAPVVEPGQRARRVYLPQGAAWIDFWSGERFAGGQCVDLPAPWDQPPLLVREGAIVPLNVAEQHFAQAADERGFALYPPPGPSSLRDEFFEDDGESEAYRSGDWGSWRVAVDGDAQTLRITVEAAGRRPPVASHVTLLLRRQETRRVESTAAKVVGQTYDAQWRRIELRLPERAGR
jgi:alpha-glucosidase